MNPYSRAPHTGPETHTAAHNAALLIDFDNVTMGMRSDLAKELKHLLSSDIIKSKVTVQRAYADWRRYPQYIVPLSEASIDLIFAPAYGSSKKNATDIRMAIDGMELVFIRPEIGTFILLTGDSDFSSLVLKLKEYGKYVIGIGIQESSSDILVQNCDEYYSYSSLTGLSKTSGGGRGPDVADPWQCTREAVARMVSRGDVMRSDRLKQVMIEISPGFDERNLGFKKFSKFLVEAANKGLLQITRAENGQYLVAPPDGQRAPKADPKGLAGKGSRRVSGGGAGTKASGPGEKRARDSSANRAAATGGSGGGSNGTADKEARAAALKLLQRALGETKDKGNRGIRDSDVKRKLLALDRSFDEGSLGFAKFSKFLLFAEEAGAVVLERLDGGNCHVRLPREAPKPDRKSGRTAEVDTKALGLPAKEESIQSYLANRYAGVGVKTAETLTKAFGTRLFTVLRDEPNKVRGVLPKSRADRVLEQWKEDHQRRVKQLESRSDRSGGGRRGSGTPKPKKGSRPQTGGTAPQTGGGAGVAPESPKKQAVQDGGTGSRAPQPRQPAVADDAGDSPGREKKSGSGIVGFLREAARRTRGRSGGGS